MDLIVVVGLTRNLYHGSSALLCAWSCALDTDTSLCLLVFDRYSVSALCCLDDPARLTSVHTRRLNQHPHQLQIDGMCPYTLGCVIVIDGAAVHTRAHTQICAHTHMKRFAKTHMQFICNVDSIYSLRDELWLLLLLMADCFI